MTGHHHSRARGGFIAYTLEGLHSAMDRALCAEDSAAGNGLLQRLDPRVKVASLGLLILVSSLTAKLWAVGAILVTAATLAAVSHISLWIVATRVWLTTLPFSFALAVPAIFMTPGTAVYRIPRLGLTATAQGVHTAAMLVLRAEAAATLALVLVFTTPWMQVLKALRMLRIPVVVVAILGMACRYILLLLETAHEMFESRKSRTVGALTRSEQRRVAVLGTGALLNRTVRQSDEVYLAMQARGFRGEVCVMDDFRMKHADWIAMTSFAALAAGLAWMGR